MLDSKCEKSKDFLLLLNCALILSTSEISSLVKALPARNLVSSTTRDQSL